MLTAKLCRDRENSWVLFCPELKSTISLEDPADLVAAAELTGWQSCDCGELTCHHQTSEATVVAAKKILRQHNKREFYLPWGTPLADRVFEEWECSGENGKNSPCFS